MPVSSRHFNDDACCSPPRKRNGRICAGVSGVLAELIADADGNERGDPAITCVGD